MSAPEQLELRPAPPIPEIAPDDPNIDFFVRLLEGQGWMTAIDIITRVRNVTGTMWNDRKVRALAKASKGRVAGGQLGYKLVCEMTNEEFNHYRNWMLSQSDEMKQRVLDSDKVFYARQSAQG